MSEFQDAFAAFLSQILSDKELTAAVDGKTSKQMLDENGEVLQMLNVFVHRELTRTQAGVYWCFCIEYIDIWVFLI